MHLLVAHIVEVRHLVALALLSGTVASLLAVACWVCFLAVCIRVVVRVFSSLCTVLAIATAVVEAGRRPAKRSPLLVQARGRPRPCKPRRAVAALGLAVCSAPAPSRPSLRLVQVRIVLRALLGHREGVIGLADCDETGRRGRIVLVVVWVVLLRQRVELPFDLLCVGCGCDL